MKKNYIFGILFVVSCVHRSTTKLNECILEKHYKCFFKDHSCHLINERLTDTQLRVLYDKCYHETGETPTAFEYSYRDTLEIEPVSNQLLETEYETLLISYSNMPQKTRSVYDTKHNLKRVEANGSITQYLREYSKDSLILQETEIINNVKSYIHRFHYNKQGKVQSKDWIYYDCCTRAQPLYDREEFEYDEQGRMIQHCKILDSQVRKKEKPSYYLYDLTDCYSYEYESDSVTIEVPFQNTNSIHPNRRAAAPFYYYKYVRQKIHCTQNSFSSTKRIRQSE